MKRLLTILALLMVAQLAFGQANELGLKWKAVQGADGYNVYLRAAGQSYTTPIDVGDVLNAVVTAPASGEVFAIVKAYKAGVGESQVPSREVAGWPRPEVSSVTADCTAGPSQHMNCTATVFGFNFAPDAVATINYSGVVVVGSTRQDENNLQLQFTIAPDAAGGAADLVVQQSWQVVAGTATPVDDDGVTGGNVTKTEAGAITITPVVLPGTVGNVAMT